MDYLWTPWRYQYIANANRDESCIFCKALALHNDEEAMIVFRGKKNFILLNRFPYTPGHVMIVPYAHTEDFSGCDEETTTEMIQLAQRAQKALAHSYRPDGYNMGMNLGRCAGAGVTGHFHLHFVPRWVGDSNFMTTISETRLQPEDLGMTFAKLRRALGS